MPENRENLPVWVFLEIIPFERLVAFYGYCAEKFKDKKMKEKSFMLRTCKEIRNACAHSSCTINNLHLNTATHKTSNSVTKEISKIEEIPKATRLKKMSNIRIQQIVTLLYTHKKNICFEGTVPLLV